VLTGGDQALPRRLAHDHAVDEDLGPALATVFTDGEASGLRERLELRFDDQRLLARHFDPLFHGREAFFVHAQHVRSRRDAERRGGRRTALSSVDRDLRAVLLRSDLDRADELLELADLLLDRASVRRGEGRELLHERLEHVERLVEAVQVTEADGGVLRIGASRISCA